MDNFSIIIPLYNEEENIIELVDEIYISLKNINYNNFEIILVNDFSKDNTLSIINKLKTKASIQIVSNGKNYGQSYSINMGIKKAKFKTIVTLDGDRQNNPIDIPILVDTYFSNKDIFLVGGIRKKRKDNLIKIFSSKIANKIRSYVFNDHCEDTGCSLKVFDKNIFLEFPFFNGIHRFLPSLFTGYGYKTLFIEVDHRPRIKGISNYGTIDRLYKGIIDMIKVNNIIKNYNNKKIL